MSIKSRLVHWLKNTALCTEHLDSSIATIQNWVSNLSYYACNDHYGVVSLDLDNIQMTRGIFEVKEVKCIFPDFSFVDYNREHMLQSFSDGIKDNKIYSLNIDLNEHFQDNKINELTVYLCKQDKNTRESQEIINEFGGKVSIYYKTPQLELSVQVKENTIHLPIGKVTVKNGSFILMDYVPPCLILNNKSLYKKIENTFVLINNKTLALRDKILSNTNPDPQLYITLQSMLQVIEKLDYILLHKLHPKQVYKYLREAIYSILWNNFSATPAIGVYSHKNIYQLLDNTINILLSIVDAGKGAKRFDLTQKEVGEFFGKPNITLGKYLTLLINPINESLVPKLKICSESYLEDVKKRRIIGAERKITKMVGNTMVLEVITEHFFKNSETICVVGADTCSQVSILTE